MPPEPACARHRQRCRGCGSTASAAATAATSHLPRPRPAIPGSGAGVGGTDASPSRLIPSARRGRFDGQGCRVAGHATQLDAAAVLEARARADDQVTHGAGDQDVAGAGLPEIRAAMCTASPAISVSSSSHSPVWMPARISMPSVSASARKASAQRMACVGPSNVARWPSPVLFTTVPPNRCASSAVISPKRCSTARHRSSPVAAACASRRPRRCTTRCAGRDVTAPARHGCR